MFRLEEIGHTISVLAGMYILTVTEFGERGVLNIDKIPIGYAWSIVFSGSIGPIVEVGGFLMNSSWLFLILRIDI